MKSVFKEKFPKLYDYGTERIRTRPVESDGTSHPKKVEFFEANFHKYIADNNDKKSTP